jgi:hypothetical protein
MASTMDWIVEPVPSVGGGGAEPAGACEDTYGTASGRSVRFNGLPLEDFLQTVIPSVCRSVYSS